MTFNQRGGIRWRMPDEPNYFVGNIMVVSTSSERIVEQVPGLLGYEAELRAKGYNDQEVLIYTRIGPKSRAIIYNCVTKLDLVRLIGEFDRQRKRPDPIFVSDGRGNEDCISQPLPSIYGSIEGDEEFSKFLYSKAPRKRFAPVEMPTASTGRTLDIGEREVKPAKEIGRDIDL